MVHFNATLCIILTRPGGFTMPIKHKPFFWEVRNNKENTDICTYCFLLLMKPQGFGHNKRAYSCITRGAWALEVTQTNPLKADRGLCSCLPPLMLCYLVPRARWERGRRAGWIFIWDWHLRLAGFWLSPPSLRMRLMHSIDCIVSYRYPLWSDAFIICFCRYFTLMHSWAEMVKMVLIFVWIFKFRSAVRGLSK